MRIIGITALVLFALSMGVAYAQQSNSVQGRRDITITRGFNFPSINSTSGAAPLPARPLVTEPYSAIESAFGHEFGSTLGSTVGGTIGGQ